MVRINQQEFRNELGELLDAIFLQDPVLKAPEYLTSSMVQLRRTLLDREHHRRDVGTLDRPRLPDWLEPHLKIGPYESTLLQSILMDAPHGVVMVRGGSGSGKSSTFQHIEHRCALAAEKMEWQNRYGFRRFIHTIDLQPACETARTFLTESEQRLLDARNVLYYDVIRSIDALLYKHLTDEAFVRLAVDASNFRSEREKYTVLEGSQAHLARALAEKSPITGLTRAAIMDVLDKLPVNDGLLARLLILTQLARAVHEDDHRRLVLIVDNVDPLPASLQNDVVNHLSALVASPMWQPFRIVVLARLSTAQHHLGVLRPVTIDHTSPDPAHVVLYRLMWFFLFPSTFTGFARLREDLQVAITARLFELWRHLLDPVGTVRQILSAMAGTNLRNGMDFAKAWCLSDKFAHDMHHRSVLYDFQASMRQLYGIQVLVELDASLGRVVDALFDSQEANEFALTVDIDGADHAAKTWSLKLAEASVDLLQDLHLLCDGDHDDEQIRHRVCVEGRQIITSALVVPETIRHITAELHLTASSALSQLVRAVSIRTSQATADTAVRAFLTCLPDAFRTVLAQFGGTQQELARPVVGWILDTIGLSSVQPVTALEITRRFLLGESYDIDVREKVLRPLFVPAMSRFNAASIMVDPGVTDPSIPPNALNVFDIDHTSVKPATLRLLYLLAKSSHGQLTVRELYDDLLLHKFVESEIRAAFRQMARTEKRLLFAGLSDSNEDIDQWLSRDAVVYLSSAGRGYYHDLLPTPAYLQWAFADIAQVRVAQQEAEVDGGVSLADRIEAALIGFRVVVNDETRRFKLAWENRDGADHNNDRTMQSLLRAAEMTCQSVTADLFFRSYPSFVFSLLSNFRRLSANDSRLAVKRVRDVTMRLRDTGKAWIDEHEELYAQRYVPWDEQVAVAERDVEEICGR